MSLNQSIACLKNSVSVALSPESSAGRRNGTSAPYSRAIVAYSSESVETITRSINFDFKAALML